MEFTWLLRSLRMWKKLMSFEFFDDTEKGKMNFGGGILSLLGY